MDLRAAWIGALMLGAACAGAPKAATSPHATLESIFWHCDYVATTKGMDATPVRECARATRELRQVKFDGSFHRMLAWWRENKPAEHERVRRSRNE